MYVYDFRDISGAASELSAVVDDLSPDECRQVLDFISAMKGNRQAVSASPISSCARGDMRQILTAYAEKSGSLLQVEPGRDGTLLASFYLDGIFEISGEDMGIKELLYRARDIYISTEDGMASFAVVVDEKAADE